jgi:cytochrome c peroxidase
MKQALVRIVLPAAIVIGLAGAIAAQAPSLTPQEQLGKHIFFDAGLSEPAGQACASCHAPSTGFTGPTSSVNAGGAVYQGTTPGRFGNRKPPSAAYAAGPVLHYDAAEEVWIGGTFWDGRATGWHLGDPLAEQAQGPFLNPVEQNLDSPADVCHAIATGSYAALFEQVWGAGSLDCDAGIEMTYERIARAVAAYERSAEVNPFSSKYDAYLAGRVRLTAAERKGLELFEGKAKCSQCHVSRPGPDGEPPMFTDFTYDNLGVPKNAANPFYRMPVWINPAGADWIDEGLGAFLRAQQYAPSVYEPEIGKQKVPTLRNVAKAPSKGFIKAFAHNGYFKSLKSIVHFYNTRDVLAPCDMVRNVKEGRTCWPRAEVPTNVNVDELGDLGLSDAEEDSIVEFMMTLSDGHK